MLSDKGNGTLKTIQKKLDSVEVKKKVLIARKIILIMDTVYFGRDFGVMVFRDWLMKENLIWKFVKYETNDHYKQGVQELKDLGFEILGIIVDGRRGLLTGFPDIPTQMCQFHQIQIVRRHLTQNPRMEASIELKKIVEIMTLTDRKSFEGLLKQWKEKWDEFLLERSTNDETGETFFKHKRLRSAYSSLERNLPYLYTYQEYLDIGMPNTTNSLEGSFAHVKDRVRLHRGLRIDRKKKLIDELLS